MKLTYVSKLRLFLFLTAFALYANTLGHDYAWDDSIVITENPRVQKGISGIPNLFLKYNSDYKADKYGYRPITLSSFAIEYGLFKNNASVSHLMNIIYFGILCVILFNVLQKLFFKYTNLPAFIITLLFIVHPIHTEVVANIKSRDEIFALLFALLFISKFLDFQKSGHIKYLLFSGLFFLLAFLSKESAIVFLALLPLTLLYNTNWNELKKLIKPTLTILVLGIICLIVVKTSASSTLGKSTSQGAGIYYESGILGNSFFYIDVFSSKLANAFCLLFMYLKNFLYPVKLVYFYGYNQIPVANWKQILVISSALFHVGIFVYSILNIKKNKEISYGILFYLISISIYLHVFRTIADTMADRFMFTPSVGIIIALVFLLSKLLKLDFTTLQISDVFALYTKYKNQTQVKYIITILVLFFGGLTFARNKVWKNDETLITHDLPALDNCSRAHSYYADILKRKLAINYDANTEASMITHYKKSIAISNEAYYSYIGLVTHYIYTKRFNESIILLDSMLIKYPNESDPNFYMGQALYGAMQFKQALPYLQKSLTLAPEVANTYYYLALALSKNGKYDEAEKTITTCKTKFGITALTYDVLGEIYFDKGNIEQSTKYTFEMLNYGGDPKLVYSKIIGRYQLLKQDKPASFYYQQAVQKGIFSK